MNNYGKPVNFQKGEEVLLLFQGHEVFSNLQDLSRELCSVFANWSWAEHWYANIRAMLEMHDASFELSNFETIRTTPPEIKKLKKALLKLNDSNREKLLLASLREVWPVALTRGSLAHGLLAYTPQRPKHLVVYRQEDLRLAFRSGLAPMIFAGSIADEMGQTAEAAFKTFAQTGVIWTATDLQNFAKNCCDAAEILRQCCTLCSQQTHVSQIAVNWLTAQPWLADQLSAG